VQPYATLISPRSTTAATSAADIYVHAYTHMHTQKLRNGNKLKE